jgi:hypothetical protein
MSYLPLLTAVNAHLRNLLSRHARGVKSFPAVSLEELRALQRCLEQVAPHLPELRVHRQTSASPAVAEYFDNLERLVPLLQTTQQWLTAKQVELRDRIGSLQRAQDWASTYKVLLG